MVEAIAHSDNKDPSEVDFILADDIDPMVLEKLGNMEDGVWEFSRFGKNLMKKLDLEH